MLIGIVMILGSLKSYAQKVDTTKRKDDPHMHMHRHIRQRLNIDSAKAEQVNTVQEKYKMGITRAVSDRKLTDGQRRLAIDSLMREKNGKLGKMLTPEQQSKIIPSTEMKKETTSEKKKP